jgi:hypothetical protein
MRIGSYDDGFDVFAIDLERVPRRDDWIANPKHNQKNRSLAPHLTEKVSVRFGPKRAA